MKKILAIAALAALANHWHEPALSRGAEKHGNGVELSVVKRRDFKAAKVRR